ncbi:hypothetical protein [Helicobacter suis]|uniref:hypothetical protein n=1 Tax=Helicobacter suis TaxID=104628 RepID=UPI0021FF007A|nr:hypothetical protein [Helicobacter suis]BDR27356.1 hypothetical protein HSHS1_01170 [Helicobacter suis HS1]
MDYSLIKWIKNGFRGFPSHENFINSLWHVLSVLSSYYKKAGDLGNAEGYYNVAEYLGDYRGDYNQCQQC